MNDNGLYKTALFYGSLSGIAIFIFYIVLYFSGFNIFGPISMIGVWIPIVFIIKATRFHRDHHLGGFINFKQGFAIGFFTTAFHVTLFGLAFYLFGVLYAGDLIEMYRAAAVESEAAGRAVFSDTLIDQTMESVDLVTMPTLAYSQSFVKMFGGAIVSVFTALLLRRNQQTTNSI